ncbi:MAG: chromosome segregation protein SMC [Candidatus Adiutrix sp.]|jgi:chromosome segregation protein|nr:chromosome segregation protein SMC [Candidatus Adiutrix sp.]
MYIKRLEIVGFKSFPERAVVPLTPGISAVVGPNGCGKSNIIDAIRWVMGEQSPRMLRGRNMDDVLFNGSQGRPASALAEVTLTLAQSEDSAKLTLAAETSVTRRLYRSGDSEYLLNRMTCRLRDVINFFTDQGVGTRAYGIIEQGRVGWLVDARPEERRSLIDEAAGITRYKHQKKEAERKIESSEANLVNVAVIKAETKKQLDQIVRAAARAARYRALKEELRELDLILSARALTAARVKRREITASREDNQRLLASLLAEVSASDLAMENIKLAEAQADKDLKDRTETWYQAISARDTLFKELEYTRNNLARAEEQRVQTLVELASLATERRRKLEEEAGLTESLAELEDACGRAGERAETLMEEWRSQKNAVDGLNREYEQIQERQSAAERRAHTLTSELAGAETLLADRRQRLDSLNAEAAEAETRANQTSARLMEATRRKASLAGEVEAAQAGALLLAEAVRLAERDQAVVAEEARKAESKLTALRAKLETLRGVKDNFDWYPQGVKKLMIAPELREAGLCGPLAEFLTIPGGYEAAVEAALGERLAWLLVENRAAALAALDYLQNNNLGRCGFLCREELAGSDLTRSLLGDYQLADKITDAAAGAQPVLTANGEYAGGGLVAGGRPEGQEAGQAGLLGRLKEVEILTQNEVRDTSELATRQALAGEAQDAAEAAREAARAAESASRAVAASLSEADKGLTLANAEAAQALDRHQNLADEKLKIGLEAEKLAQALAEGQARRAEAVSETEILTARSLKLKEDLEDRRTALEALRETSEAARLAAAAAVEKLDRGRHDLDQVTEWLAGVEERLDGRETQAAKLAADLERFSGALAQLETRAAAGPGQVTQAEVAVAEAKDILEAEKKKRESREAATREIRRRREETSALLASQETDLQAVNFSLERIEEDLRREWKVTLIDPETPVETSWPLEAEETPLERLDPKEWAARPLPEGAEDSRHTLKSKISSLGEVSLEAIEREAELKTEYERYQTQYDDLTRAIADLKDSIARINHTCRLRFAETFLAVDAKFREIFPILFEGGEGWLSLADENDPLESGVEIHVHPPGKKLLVMSLLSGGEKALTALALIFALYLIKPSPFCLLDETDAPLDEANIDRFNRLLGQLSRASQIIMVTHNKRTMQISQTLYGVTMETPGVSRLVSVNLAEAEALTADV